MAKKITGFIKLQIPAGKANPSPPVGPALGQRGVNIMEFCKQFNAKTQEIEPGTPLPVIITVFADRSFSFITKTPPASYLILKRLGLGKGSKTPGREVIRTINKEELREIAKVKAKDLNSNNEEAALEIVAGTARSMGIQVKG